MVLSRLNRCFCRGLSLICIVSVGVMSRARVLPLEGLRPLFLNLQVQRTGSQQEAKPSWPCQVKARQDSHECKGLPAAHVQLQARATTLFAVCQASCAAAEGCRLCALPGRKVLLINAVHIKERLADLRPPYEGDRLQDTVEWPQGRMRKGTGWVGTCRMRLRGGGQAQAGLSCAARAANAQQATARPAG